MEWSYRIFEEPLLCLLGTFRRSPSWTDSLTLKRGRRMAGSQARAYYCHSKCGCRYLSNNDPHPLYIEDLRFYDNSPAELFGNRGSVFYSTKANTEYVLTSDIARTFDWICGTGSIYTCRISYYFTNTLANVKDPNKYRAIHDTKHCSCFQSCPC
jgi:hypothetical protein